MTTLLVDRIDTPIGIMYLSTDEDGVLRFTSWSPPPASAGACVPTRDPFGVSSALRAYFDGELAAIDDLVVDGVGTDFQRQVWRALRQIPAGTTESYGALAARIGAPKAVRAVGAANGANPNGVIVPCHRVIGKDGTLTGYGGGLERKKWLLAHEARYAIGASGPLFAVSSAASVGSRAADDQDPTRATSSPTRATNASRW